MSCHNVAKFTNGIFTFFEGDVSDSVTSFGVTNQALYVLGSCAMAELGNRDTVCLSKIEDNRLHTEVINRFDNVNHTSLSDEVVLEGMYASEKGTFVYGDFWITTGMTHASGLAILEEGSLAPFIHLGGVCLSVIDWNGAVLYGGRFSFYGPNQNLYRGLGKLFSLHYGLPEPPNDFPFHVYPNPATHGFFIRGVDHQPEAIELTDLNGKVVLSTNNRYEVVTTNLPPGTYVLTVSYDQGKRARTKIVVQ